MDEPDDRSVVPHELLIALDYLKTLRATESDLRLGW